MENNRRLRCLKLVLIRKFPSLISTAFCLLRFSTCVEGLDICSEPAHTGGWWDAPSQKDIKIRMPPTTTQGYQRRGQTPPRGWTGLCFLHAHFWVLDSFSNRSWHVAERAAEGQKSMVGKEECATTGYPLEIESAPCENS